MENQGRKSEYMTELFGNETVLKTHPKIKLRGALDSFQSRIILAQALIAKEDDCLWLISDLDDILEAANSLMRAEVCGLEFDTFKIIGLTPDEIHKHSHDPQKYYGVKQLLAPDHKLGLPYCLVNDLRCLARECEILACEAFYIAGECTREDIIIGYNRLSSALHIMMCKIVQSAEGNVQR